MKRTTDQWTSLIHDASALYQSVRTRLPAGVYSLAELPDETAEEAAAWSAMKDIGRQIYDQGGEGLMVDVYRRGIEKHDHSGMRGVRWAWHGIGNWLS